jgi:hypothetical protein
MYDKTTWVDETTPAIEADNLNNIEEGIEASHNGSAIYAASSTGNDSYAITFSPALASYTTGLTVRFKADVANTGVCTLNINSLGAKTIKKNVTSDLEDNDILANMIVTVVYDGTNFQLQPHNHIDFYTYYATAGSTELASADTERTINNTSFTVLKEFRVKWSGTYTITFNFHGTLGQNATVRGAVNGVEDAATDQLTSSTTYVSGTFNIYAYGGAVISVKVKTSSAPDAGYIKDVKLKATLTKSQFATITD